MTAAVGEELWIVLFTLEIAALATVLILPLAYLVRNLPIAGRAVLAGYRQLDPALEEAAASLGAGRWATLGRVTIAPWASPPALTRLAAVEDAAVLVVLAQHALVGLPQPQRRLRLPALAEPARTPPRSQGVGSPPLMQAGSEAETPGRIEPSEGGGKATGKKGVYIVRMAGDPVATYSGGIQGHSATKPGKGRKIDPTWRSTSRSGQGRREDRGV